MNDKIVRVKIKNFRGIEELTFLPGKKNALLGECGKGKTSVLNAIAFAFSGKGDASFIRNDEKAKSCKVEITFESGDVLTRTRDKSSVKQKVNGDCITKDVAEQVIRSKGFFWK